MSPLKHVLAHILQQPAPERRSQPPAGVCGGESGGLRRAVPTRRRGAAEEGWRRAARRRRGWRGVWALRAGGGAGGGRDEGTGDAPEGDGGGQEGRRAHSGRRCCAHPRQPTPTPRALSGIHRKRSPPQSARGGDRESLNQSPRGRLRRLSLPAPTTVPFESAAAAAPCSTSVPRQTPLPRQGSQPSR